MNDLRLIEKLSNANGAPGFEDEVIKIIKEELIEICDVTISSILNVVAERRTKNSESPKILLDGHSDEVAFMVQSICENGLIRFLPLGGWWDQTVLAHKVRIRNNENRYIPAIVASIPPHFLPEEKRNNVVKIKEMFLDVGACSVQEVLEDFGIEPGAPIIPDVNFFFNKENNMMCGKAFDNRLGTTVALTVMKELNDENLNVEPVVGISSQEEIGTRGALVTARTVNPDIAIVFEGSPADDGIRNRYEVQTAVRKGPHIRHRDNSMVSNPRFTAFARNVAKEQKLPFQDAVRWSGGTNGGKIHLEQNSIPTIVIGIPVRYVHTHYGWSSYNDFRIAVEWGKAIVRSLNKEVIATF